MTVTIKKLDKIVDFLIKHDSPKEQYLFLTGEEIAKMQEDLDVIGDLVKQSPPVAYSIQWHRFILLIIQIDA